MTTVPVIIGASGAIGEAGDDVHSLNRQDLDLGDGYERKRLLEGIRLSADRMAKCDDLKCTDFSCGWH